MAKGTGYCQKINGCRPVLGYSRRGGIEIGENECLQEVNGVVAKSHHVVGRFDRAKMYNLCIGV
jgi:hypothetical protein